MAVDVEDVPALSAGSTSTDDGRDFYVIHLERDANLKTDDLQETETEQRVSTSSRTSPAPSSKPGSPVWTLANYASVQPMDVDTAEVVDTLESKLLYPLSSHLDERSRNLLQIFVSEGGRFSFIGPFPIALSVQLFHHEPAYQHLLNACVTLSHADYEPPRPDSKEFVYSSVLAAIKRMRLEADDMDDEAHLKCRALLAMVEVSRVHGANDFSGVINAVTSLFATWQEEMHRVEPRVAQRRHEIMKRYMHGLNIGAKHFKCVKEIKASPRPQRPTKPNFQTHFFDFVAGVEVTSLMTEAYGFSIAVPTDKPALEKRLKSWYKSFEAATAYPEMMEVLDVVEARILMAHYLRAKILLDACVPNTETRYARHYDDYAVLLDCVERVLASDYWLHEKMWLGLVCPLFFTAVTCRKRAIRHKALDVLRAHHISERSWNSRVAYLIASAVVAVESSHELSNDEQDPAFVRLLNADYKRSTEKLIITYIDVHTKAQKTFEMQLFGAEDLNACNELSGWPLVVEVRTHGAAFSKTPLGGPLDHIGNVDGYDYLKWLRAALKPRKMLASSVSPASFYDSPF